MNVDALSGIESYELNQDDFGTFEGSLMGNWGTLCENDMLQGVGQP